LTLIEKPFERSMSGRNQCICFHSPSLCSVAKKF
jgi:hypothetical protein